MGTHPIFESDFDCLTANMGDLATEIEQMQNDIHAFDEELDALEQNGGDGAEGKKEKDKPRKRARSGSAGGGKQRRSDLEEGEEVDDDDEDDGNDENKNKRKLKSAVVFDSSRRKSSISKEDINKAQIGGAQGKKRATRLFANLLGTLRTFDAKSKDEAVNEKRAEIDKKVDEKIATDRRKIIEEKRGLMKRRLEKERLLGMLQTKQDMAESSKTWEDNSSRRAKFIQTKAEPSVLWAPKTWSDATSEMVEASVKKEKSLMKERRKEWAAHAVELDEEVKAIKEANDFDEKELTLVSSNGRAKLIDKDDARNIIRKVDNSDAKLEDEKPVKSNKRLVITKTVNNDTRRVKPREEDNEENEIKRKRRHGSSSSSDESEEEYVERKTPIMTKDVRRVAAKEEEEEHMTPVNRRRITVKRQSDSSKSEQDKAKRRRVAKDEKEKSPEPIKTRKRSDTSESESEPTPPPRRRSRGRR